MTTPSLISPLTRPRHSRGLGVGLIPILILLALIILAVISSIILLNKRSSSGSTTNAAAMRDRAKATIGSFDITTTAMGELEAANQVEIRSELDTPAGIIEIVPEGTVVKKGDLLVQLNAETLQNQIDQQTLEVEQARANVTAAENALKIQLSENDSRTRAGQLKVELAQLALKQWEDGDVPKKRASLQLEIDQAQRDLKRLSELFERSEKLLKQGFLSKDERDRDEINYINAKARLQTAKLDQKVYEEYQHPRDEKTKRSDVEQAQADLQRIQSQNEINASAKRAALDAAKRQLALKEQRLEKLKEQFNLATITAPTDGLVVYATSIGRGRDMMIMGGDGPLTVGRQVRPKEKLIVLPDTSNMVAAVRVHEALAGQVRPGTKATVRIDALNNQTFPGTVESIGVLAESGGWRDPNKREYTVKIALDNTNINSKLKPSMRAEATITLGSVSDALIVPVQAIFVEGPVHYVLVPQGSHYKRVPVKVGKMSDTFAQILSGIDEGQEVLIRDPLPGEVIDEPWDTQALAAVGISLDEHGKPVKHHTRPRAQNHMPDNLTKSTKTRRPAPARSRMSPSAG